MIRAEQIENVFDGLNNHIAVVAQTLDDGINGIAVAD